MGRPYTPCGLGIKEKLQPSLSHDCVIELFDTCLESQGRGNSLKFYPEP